ncbi:MAG: Spermidine/spermine N(1)-acetyltransferase [Syntrophomonadaceae bacterium]|nr:Spermidine/spermine N(1)-acetyltransferase [Bacillota bacterium]MBT9147833.1 Spermidine/spermine N(1)-acetyltransferase [Bacillota bacterium]
MIQIRMAKEEDIEQILSIAKQVNKMIQQHRSEFFGKLREFRRTPYFYSQAIRAKDSIIFVAEEKKGDVVGYVYATIERKQDDLITIPCVSVNEIAVKTKYQGSGVGKFLMDYVHEWTHKNGIHVIQLAVWEFNKGALKLYEKMGYKTIMRKMEKVLK